MSILAFLICAFSISLVNCKIYDVATALNVELQSAFPADAFNSSCVSASCPNLNNPNVFSTSGSSYDLNATFTSIRECAGGTVCGLQIEPRPILFIQFSLTQLIQGIPLIGSCNSTPNCVYANVVPTFNVISEDKVGISLPNLKFHGNIVCGLSQSLTSALGLPLPSIKLPALNVSYEYNFNYSSTLEINDDNSVEVNNPKFKVTGVNFNGLKFPSFPGIPNYLNKFKALVDAALGRMSLPTYLGGFYQNLVQSALEVAADNCNH